MINKSTKGHETVGTPVLSQGSLHHYRHTDNSNRGSILSYFGHFATTNFTTPIYYSVNSDDVSKTSLH